MLKYFSMFSGIGGFELGIQRAEIKSENSTNRESTTPQLSGRSFCVGYSEIDKHAIQCYEHHFKGHKNYGDANTIEWGTVPDFDLFVGGFPCQAFSIAGKRKGFSDTRGTLFFQIERALRAKTPRYILLENVKGLLSHDDGRTFQTIIKILTEIGYLLQWQILNSKDFGVPQNRERVFIVGHFGGECFREVFPIRENDNAFTTKGGRQASDAVVSRTLTATDAKMHLDGNYVKSLIKKSQSIPDTQRIRDIGESSVTLKGGGGGQGGKTGLYAIPVLTPDRPEKRQNGRRMKEDGDTSFTLTAQDKHGVFDGYRIRRLTPTECERLQGFPDGYTSMLSDTQRYKCLGNSVTCNVIEEIIYKMFI